MHPNSFSRGSKPIRFARVLLVLLAVLAAAPARAAVTAGAKPPAGTTTSASATPTRAIAPARLSPAVVAQRVRTVAQDIRGATFEVTPAAARFDSVNVGGALYMRPSIPGAAMIETPGKPALPTISLHVAVPDGMSPRLKLVSEDWETRRGLMPVPVARERFLSDDPRTGPVSQTTTEPDPAVYQSAAVYPAEEATLGAGAMVGEWWVVPVRVRPLRWDPRAAAYRVLRSMTLRVDFVPATDREMKGRPAVRPGAQARAWDRVQRGLVKNYESARAFPVRPRAGSLGAAPLSGLRAGTRLAANPEWRLSVDKSGWVSVSYATLAASGFPSGIDIANVRVEERGYDDGADTATVVAVPVVARDTNTIGTFDSGDAITFYARSLRDRYGAGNIELRYSDVNAYWLTWGSTPAPTPSTVSGSVSGTPPTPTSFRDVIRLEEDHVAMMDPNNTLTNPPEAIEYLFWTDGLDGDQFSTSIPFVDPDPSQPFRVRARYQGHTFNIGQIHRLTILFQGSTGVVDTLTAGDEFVDKDVYLLDTGFTVPGADIGPGALYRHIGTHRQTPTSTPIDPSNADLDVIEVTYSRFYRAVNNALRFTSGETAGPVELHVGGFTAPAIEIYDVTDPLAPARVNPADVSVVGTGPYEARFQTDASGGQRRFVALIPGAETALTGSAVVADAPSNLRVPGGFGSSNLDRAILVTPDAFLAQANRLADYRRGQGYVVEVASIQDVYDEFNGGIKSARAIRRYLRHAYLAWTPRPMFVVLCGDGSLDYRHHIESSGVDWIPSYFRFEDIASSAGYALVSQDPYYALNLSQPEPGPSDFVPGVSLTRIPASSASELGTYVDKVIAYEAMQPTDSWRGRELLYSDDQYSTGLLFGQNYCFMPAEQEFLGANQEMADIVAQTPWGADLRTDFYDLHTYTDNVPASGGCKSLQDVRSYLQSSGGYAQFFNKINLGGLILNAETHANRYLLAHEEVLCNGSPTYCATGNGPDQVQNLGRPYLFMVWGCHTNQFADEGILGRQSFGAVDSSDALGEQWLLMPNRGSIGSLGSAGYEYLTSNHNYNKHVARAFFDTPPSPNTGTGSTPQARWILGEVMLGATVSNAFDPGIFQNMNHTIHLFADPMLRMDALPPRVADVTVAGAAFTDQGSLTDDSPTDSLALVANLRDEVGIDSVYVAEKDLASGAITLLDPATWSVAFADSSRIATLTGNVRPHVGNYDLQIRGVDVNGRTQIFTLQVRTPIRYQANGVDIVNGVFVENGAILRAEVTAPIPLTPDSLALLIDGIPVGATKTALDAPTNRRWALTFTASDLFTGTHTLQVAIGGRTAGFDQRTFQTTTEFTLRGVAVVDPRVQGAGCDGSIFQYELSAAARSVTLQLFTVAGRRVASIDLPGQSGLNVYCWDGRDSEAHETARGVYLFRIRATDPTGKTVSRDGRMIRAGALAAQR